MDSRTLLVVLLAAACGVLGWRWLRTGRYRRPDEGGPLPRHLWVAGVAPFVGLVVERGLVDRTWPVLLAPLALALAGLVLAAVGVVLGLTIVRAVRAGDSRPVADA